MEIHAEYRRVPVSHATPTGEQYNAKAVCEEVEHNDGKVGHVVMNESHLTGL